MSNLPPNPYNHTFGSPPMNANIGQPMHPGQQYSQPLNQPNYTGLKQDPNSNSLSNLPPPITHSSGPVSSAQQVNNFSQSANSSPAFNRPGMMPSPMPGLHSSQLRPPLKPMPTSMPGISQFPSTSAAQNTSPQMSGQSPFPPTNASPYPPNYTQQQARQINDIAPPLTPASQPYNPAMNGPPMPYPPGTAFSQPSGQYPPTSTITGPATSSYGQPGAMNLPPGQPVMSSPHMLTRPGPPQTNNQITAPSRNSPLPGPPTSGGATIGPPRPMNGPVSHTVGPHLGPPISQAPLGPPKGPVSSGPNLMGIPSRPSVGPASGPSNGPSINGTALGPRSYGPPSLSGIPGQPPMGPPNMGGPQSLPPTGLHSGSATGPQSLPPAPPMGQPMNAIPPSSGKMPGPPMNNMYNRYPQMPQSNFNNQSQQMPPAGASRPYPQQQYNAQGMTQQMSQLSVTKQGFDQLWGHHMVDLMQCKHILPEYPEDPPEIKLGHQFAESDNCSPEILRCTVNRIPETNNLLQKSRLPLGILIHPFKDLNHLPVIQCATIVRCRACRTYINPFVYFVDSKRWKCNLCYRVNDLPEEFQYDPVSKSYGDPSRRPEIRSATIEFIAPGEYMLRPPQPAVYLFLLDVSQRARESGYLQVFCDTLKSCLDKLPGDARTQVGFICYDAHIHYYLMSEELNRPKEMTVLDVDDIFLPSPESLLVNLGERRELIIELLSVLPRRYSAQGAPSSALGAALQAAYKLMAPTGGRVSVFQTCLPNVGPGALQAREDPNARSSKDVAHLNPATDFYKRLALDCSGAQVAVDLFLLNSQYSDLATLSGMSKFSAGSVHHIPLFNATRSWQADHFQRMLNRYLTRKIGFEAVMRVRCTRGIAIHTFHGNFFVRSTDLLSLPNVSPDAAFGMQLAIEESLADLQQVCFQAALLYTSSKGERRIRVHTLALPIANNLTDVLHSADQECIVGLLSKMAVDRCASASMSEAREALINVAVDALSAHRLAQNLPAGAASPGLHAPMSLALLPLHLLALLKTKAFRTGTSTRLDDRVADMCALKTQPLSVLLRAVYPALYPIHALEQQGPHGPNPPRLQLTAERINATGAYLLDDGETMIIYVCHAVSPAYLSDTFGATSFSQLPDEARALPALELDGNENLHAFIDRLNDDRPFPANVLLIKDTSPSRTLFTERLIEDRVESAFSYYEFLQHVKNQVK